MLNNRRWLIVALFIVYAVVHLCVYWHFTPQFVDDAYITFRYAARIAEGKGFTFNDILGVLGTTTPLWTFLLAVFFGLGAPLSLAVGTLSALSAALFCTVTFLMLSDLKCKWLGLLGGPTLLIYERWLFGYLMGMESVLYIAIVVLIIWLASRKAWTGIGFLGALAFLCRPDGLVIAFLGIITIVFYNCRAAMRESLFFMIALLPWLIFCLAFFGTIVPHSVAAKQVIHSASFSSIVISVSRTLLQDRFIIQSIGAMLAGAVVVILYRRNYWYLFAWPLLYNLGLGASRIQVGLFPWYLVPLIGALWLLGLFGIGGLGVLFFIFLKRQGVKRSGLSANVLACSILACIVWNSRGFLQRNWREFPSAFVAKERYYLHTAEQLKDLIRPGAKVLVGDVGVFSYVLDHASIIDSSGINSPLVYKIRSESPSGNVDRSKTELPEWVLEVIGSVQPDWIISLPQFLGLESVVSHHPENAPDYELLSGKQDSPGELVILKRRETPR